MIFRRYARVDNNILGRSKGGAAAAKLCAAVRPTSRAFFRPKRSRIPSPASDATYTVPDWLKLRMRENGAAAKEPTPLRTRHPWAACHLSPARPAFTHWHKELYGMRTSSKAVANLARFRRRLTQKPARGACEGQRVFDLRNETMQL